jgi:hypothetical protein
MASICDTINCTDGLPTVPTPDCGGINYGRKVVRLYVGEIDANPFASTSNIQTLADWNTRLAEPSTGDTQVRLVSLGYIYEGLKGEGEVETEESWTGGVEMIEGTQRIEGYLKRFTADTFEAINKLRCQKAYTVWFVTDKDYVFGGLTGLQRANLMLGNFEIVGNGNGSNRVKVTLEWRTLDDTTPYLCTGLADALNTAN